jgi:hypothetical protein
MLINHPAICASRSYPLGAINRAAPDWTYRDVDGNTFAMLEGQLYNVHPATIEDGGFGIRWKCGEAEQDRIVADREFMASLCRF